MQCILLEKKEAQIKSVDRKKTTIAMNQLLAPSGSFKMINKAHDCLSTSDPISNSMGNGSEYHEWARFVHMVNIR